MARVSIYVPDGLRVQMDAAADAMNWSDIARSAFNAAIAAHQHRKGPSMQTAIERLRASKQKSGRFDFEKGRALGRQQAADRLEYDQLVAVSKIGTALEEDQAIEVLRRALDPERDLNDHEYREFLMDGGDARLSGQFALGYIDGARHFFEEVKDDL